MGADEVCGSNLMVTELSTIFLHINAFFLMTDSAKGKVCALLRADKTASDSHISNRIQIFVTNGLCLLFAFTHRVIISLYLTHWLYTMSHEIMRVSPFLYGSYIHGSLE